MAEPLLNVCGLEGGYGDIQVLWGIDLDVDPGSIVSVVGSNGAGKTTLLLALSGVVPAKRGSISFSGEDVTGFSPRAIVTRGISHVPEGRRLFKTLSVRDNFLLGAFHRTTAPRSGGISISCFRSSRGCGSGRRRTPTRCRAASSRCAPSAAASWRGRAS